MTPEPLDDVHDVLSHDQRRARRPHASQPLRRSREHAVVAGVCGGMADFVGASPRLVRTVWLVSLVPFLGMTAIGYVLLWWLVPREQATGT